jgi:hypothetical protein
VPAPNQETTIPKLNDTKRILLSTAAQRESGSVCPLPDTITGDDKRKDKTIEALVKRGFAEQRETSDKASIYRSDDGVGFGMFLTEAGRAAIDGGHASGAANAPQPAAAPTPRVSKSSMGQSFEPLVRFLELSRGNSGTNWGPMPNAENFLRNGKKTEKA